MEHNHFPTEHIMTYLDSEHWWLRQKKANAARLSEASLRLLVVLILLNY